MLELVLLPLDRLSLHANGHLVEERLDRLFVLLEVLEHFKPFFLRHDLSAWRLMLQFFLLLLVSNYRLLFLLGHRLVFLQVLRDFAGLVHLRRLGRRWLYLLRLWLVLFLVSHLVDLDDRANFALFHGLGDRVVEIFRALLHDDDLVLLRLFDLARLRLHSLHLHGLLLPGRVFGQRGALGAGAATGPLLDVVHAVELGERVTIEPIALIIFLHTANTVLSRAQLQTFFAADDVACSLEGAAADPAAEVARLATGSLPELRARNTAVRRLRLSFLHFLGHIDLRLQLVFCFCLAHRAGDLRLNILESLHLELRLV